MISSENTLTHVFFKSFSEQIIQYIPQLFTRKLSLREPKCPNGVVVGHLGWPVPVRKLLVK